MTASERIREARSNETRTTRQATYRRLYIEERAKLTPNCGGDRLSGQQLAYAKGRATMRFMQLDREGFFA